MKDGARHPFSVSMKDFHSLFGNNFLKIDRFSGPVLHRVPAPLGGITPLLLGSSSRADASEAEDQNGHELNYGTEKT